MSRETDMPKGRRRLALVIRAAGELIRNANAERVLQMNRSEAACRRNEFWGALMRPLSVEFAENF